MAVIKTPSRRSRDLSEVASSMGWDFQPGASHLVGRWGGSPFRHSELEGPAIGTEDTRSITNVLTGQHHGMHAVAFDYLGLPGKSRHHEGIEVDSVTLMGIAAGFKIAKTLWSRRRLDSLVPQIYSVVMLSLPGTFPGLEVAHQGVLAQGEKILGAPDTDFEVAEFNRRWRIEGDVPKTTHDILNPRLIEFLLAGPRWSFRIEGSDIWTWRPGMLPTPGAGDFIVERLDWLSGIVSHIPEFVWLEHGASPGGPRPGRRPHG